MDPNHLSFDQLQYELKIRGENNIFNRRDMVTSLKQYLRDEYLKKILPPKSSSAFFSAESELEECTVLFDSIIKQADFTTNGKNDVQKLKFAQSKLLHLHDRLRRVGPLGSETDRQIEETIMGTGRMLKRIFAALSECVSSLHVPVHNQFGNENQQIAGAACMSDESIPFEGFQSNEIQKEQNFAPNRELIEFWEPNLQDESQIHSRATSNNSFQRNVAANILTTILDNNINFVNRNRIHQNNSNVDDLNIIQNLNLNSNKEKSSNKEKVNPLQNNLTNQNDQNRKRDLSHEAAKIESLENKIKHLERLLNNQQNHNQINNREYEVPQATQNSRLNHLLQEVNNRIDALNFTPARMNINSDHDNEPPNQHDLLSRNNNTNRGSNTLQEFDFSRRRVPPFQWKICYNGEGSTIDLFNFLRQVQALRRAENVNDDREMIYSMIHLLTGKARIWYLGIYEYLRTWADFEEAIKAEFLPANHDFVLSSEIERDKQQPNETISAFVSRIRAKFACLSSALSDAKQVFIVIKNLLPEYAMTLSSLGLRNLNELMMIGKRMDSVRPKTIDRNMYANRYQIKQPFGNKYVNELQEQNIQLQDDVEIDAINYSFNNQKNYRQNYNSSQINPATQQRNNNTSQTMPVSSSNNASTNNVSSNRNQLICWNCQVIGHRWTECNESRENKIFCYGCGKQNVTIKFCQKCGQKYRNNNVSEVEVDQQLSINEIKYEFKPFFSFPEILLIDNPTGDNRPHVTVKILDKELIGLLDSGANASVLGKGADELLNKLKIMTKPYKINVKTADGTTYTVNEYADLPFEYNGQCRIISTLIVPNIATNLILGMDFWNAFNIKPQIVSSLEVKNDKQDSHILNDAQLTELQNILDVFPFSKENQIGCTGLLKHNIDTKDAKPIKQKQYVVSPHIQKEIHDEIDRWLNLGIIEPAFGSWSNPIVAVRKTSGKLRLCLDARKLNEITVKEAYPLPDINRIFANFNKTEFVSSIDLSESFLQIKLDDESKPKTAFAISGKGYFCFKRMPFGLCNSSSTMSRLMDLVIGCDLEPYVFVYLDDIVIATETFDHHMFILKEISKRLKCANLTVSSEKSKFCLKRINYLGYVIGDGGIRTNPDKVSSIVNFPTPTCIKEVRRLIGVASWYRRFIENFATLVSPLTDLTKISKKKPQKKFIWTEAAENAFRKFKSILISEPVLTTPDYSLPFTIQTDASDIGIGAVLTQGTSSDEKVICYMSQKLSAAERKYSATERELLAVISAIMKFRPYIEGSKFTVITDNSSLQFLRNLKEPTGRLARWALKLQQFDFQVIHRKGSQNVVPDALSRSIALIDVSKFKDDTDSHYKTLFKNVQDKQQKFSQFQIHNDILYKYCSNKISENIDESNWRIYVPPSSRINVLKECHDSTLASHGGCQKTINRIKEWYYWPKLQDDVKKYVAQCDICKSTKPSNIIMKAPMGKHREFERPWQAIAMDFVGPLPLSKNGNRHLLVVVDLFSKFVSIHPLRMATAKHTINFLENRIFSVFGVPQYVISDNGSQFCSNEFQKFLATYKVKHWLTSRYHPQANAAEAANKTVVKSIRAYIQQNQENHRMWDTQLSKIACAMNTAVHSSSKFSPYFINFGQNMSNSGDAFDHPMYDDDNDANRKTKISKIRNIVFDNLKKTHELSKKSYNLRTRPINFVPGETVWRRNFIKSNAGKYVAAKLCAKFLKAIVKKKIGSSSYELVDLNGKSIGTYSAKDLKKDS